MHETPKTGRSLCRGFDSASDQLKLNLTQAIKFAYDGRAIMFAGAGFSAGASSVRGPIKRSSGLVDHFVSLTGLTREDGLESLAEAYARDAGIDALIREVGEEFTARATTRGQRILAAVPWRRVYTTNYDNVFEVAANEIARKVNSVSLSHKPTAVAKGPQDAMLVVHLNGFVGVLDRNTVRSELKLTDTSYLSDIVASPWLTLFRQDVALARAVFFVGYSLYDLDIRRVLSENADLSAKSFVILGNAPNDAVVRRAERFGLVVRIDTEAFSQQAEAVARSYTPLDDGPLPYCLERFAPTAPPVPLEDRFVFDLLAYGEVRDDYVWDSLQGREPYVLHRQIVDQALDAIREGAQVVALHSALGNGKTICLEVFKSRARDLQYTIYCTRRHGESLHEELHNALKTDRPIMFVVDDYGEWHDFLDILAMHFSHDIVLILAARSLTHDVQIDYIEDQFGDSKIVEIPVDRLTDADTRAVVTYLTRYGLWGDKAAWPDGRKKAFLVGDCGDEWHAILLRILQSPQILSKLEELFAEIRPNGVYYDPILAILILAVLQHNTTVIDLVALCGPKVLDVGFKLNPAVAQLVNFERGDVRLRSSTAARFILQRIADPNAIVNVLISLMRSSDASAGVSRSLRDLAGSIMRFGAFSALFAEGQAGRAAMRLYESVKDLSLCRHRPLFWLQYAIASIAASQLTRAGTYFETAYSYARDIPGYNTYQIDNHFARYLLLRAAASRDPVTSMADFRQARKIIVRELAGNERLHYPFRVAAEIEQVYDLIRGLLSAEDQAELRNAAAFVVERINRLPVSRRQQKNVQDCLGAMRRVIGAA